MSERISAVELQRRQNELEQVLWTAWDKGYSEGLEPNYLLADMQDYVASQTELGRMDAQMKFFWERWKKNRGIE